MTKGDRHVCTTLIIKRILEKCRQYEIQREELNLSHLARKKPGLNPDNEINKVGLFKSKILNLI